MLIHIPKDQLNKLMIKLTNSSSTILSKLKENKKRLIRVLKKFQNFSKSLNKLKMSSALKLGKKLEIGS